MGLTSTDPSRVTPARRRDRYGGVSTIVAPSTSNTQQVAGDRSGESRKVKTLALAAVEWSNLRIGLQRPIPLGSKGALYARRLGVVG